MEKRPALEHRYLRPFNVRTLTVFAALVSPLVLSCGESNGDAEGADGESGGTSDTALMGEIDAVAQSMIDACPMSDPGDQAARDACAKALASSEELKRNLSPTILWGGFNEERAEGTYDPSKQNTTSFAALAWRKLYGSTYMMKGTYDVEDRGSHVALLLDVDFRSEMDPGDYPYPFWHSEDKWDAYVRSATLMVVFEKSSGKIVASHRASPPGPAVEPVEWNGEWIWQEGGEMQPRVVFYDYLLSPDNPHKETLNQAFRELEEDYRDASCFTCHVPANAQEINPLTILVYPNQSLGDRHLIVHELEEQEMPPAVGDTPAGIMDEELRTRLLEKAQAFAKAGDDALAWEGEPS